MSRFDEHHSRLHERMSPSPELTALLLMICYVCGPVQQFMGNLFGAPVSGAEKMDLVKETIAGELAHVRGVLCCLNASQGGIRQWLEDGLKPRRLRFMPMRRVKSLRSPGWRVFVVVMG